MKWHYLVIASAAGAALALSAGTAQAWGFGCKDCGGAGGHGAGKSPPSSLFPGGLFGGYKPKLPAFQAAPWYNYWPYDGHFLMPAPITGPFYGPPMTGNFPVNPYFPGPAGAYGYGGAYGFGPGIPGGPPPMPPPGTAPQPYPAPGTPPPQSYPAPGNK